MTTLLIIKKKILITIGTLLFKSSVSVSLFSSVSYIDAIGYTTLCYYLKKKIQGLWHIESSHSEVEMYGKFNKTVSRSN